MWKVEIRKDRFVLLAHFPDSEHYGTFKRPPNTIFCLGLIQPTRHCDNPHHHSLVIIWREVSDALPSPSSITSLATKTKIVFEFKNQHIYSLFCEDRDWVISVSHPILIFDRNFSRNIDSWQSVLLVKKDIFGGAERGERWFMSQDLPSLIFTSYFISLTILHLSFTFHILCHKIYPFLIITFVHLKFNIFFMLYLEIMFSLLCHMIHTYQIFTSYYPGTIPLFQFLCQSLNRVWAIIIFAIYMHFPNSKIQLGIRRFY